MILVTGASRGLGYALCAHFSGKGSPVLGVSRSSASSPFAASPSASFETVVCDVTDPQALKTLAHSLQTQGKGVSVLINAAGIASMNLALTTPPATAEKIIKTNLLGSIYACQQFVPHMIRAKSGRVINFSTIAVPLALEGESVYVASKAGVEAFTRTFAREVAGFGITVNCIAPGPIDTDLIKGVPEAKIQRIVDRQAIKRKFTPADVCALADMLISDAASGLTGQVFHLGGV
jgi:3-oxoacyl-[acyl-carrier protein] reductase